MFQQRAPNYLLHSNITEAFINKVRAVNNKFFKGFAKNNFFLIGAVESVRCAEVCLDGALPKSALVLSLIFFMICLLKN